MAADKPDMLILFCVRLRPVTFIVSSHRYTISNYDKAAETSADITKWCAGAARLG
jgi:hypothetical protein